MKRFLVVTMYVMLSCILADTAVAHHPPTPEEIEGVRTLSPEEAKVIIENEDIIIVDSRKSWHYTSGHIKNAISLPHKWVTSGDIPARKGTFDMSKLPPDKEAKIIFYSDGVHNWDSYNSSKNAYAVGYRNIMWMRKGYKGWVEKGYPTEK